MVVSPGLGRVSGLVQAVPSLAAGKPARELFCCRVCPLRLFLVVSPTRRICPKGKSWWRGRAEADPIGACRLDTG